MTGRTYTTWTSDELRRLAQAVVTLRETDPVPSLVALVNRAQAEVLPRDRRRKVRGRQNIGAPLMDAIRDALTDRDRTRADAAVAGALGAIAERLDALTRLVAGSGGAPKRGENRDRHKP